MTGSLRAFIEDREANVATTLIGLFFLIVIPLVLFALLFRYLKQSAPEGAVAAPVGGAPKAKEEEVDAMVAGARKCHRCGFNVKPHKGGGGRECPNCGAGLG